MSGKASGGEVRLQQADEELEGAVALRAREGDVVRVGVLGEVGERHDGLEHLVRGAAAVGGGEGQLSSDDVAADEGGVRLLRRRHLRQHLEHEQRRGARHALPFAHRPRRHPLLLLLLLLPVRRVLRARLLRPVARATSVGRRRVALRAVIAIGAATAASAAAAASGVPLVAVAHQSKSGGK